MQQTTNTPTLRHGYEPASVLFLSNERPQIEEAAASFLSFLDTAPTTAKTYAKALKVFFEWLEKEKIERPTREDLIAYRKELLATRKSTTTASYINALKQFFKWLDYNGLCAALHRTDRCRGTLYRTVWRSIERHDYRPTLMLSAWHLPCAMKYVYPPMPSGKSSPDTAASEG